MHVWLAVLERFAEIWQFFLHYVDPEVSTGGVVHLSIVEDQRQGVDLWLGGEGEGSRDRDSLPHQTQGTPGDGV